MHYQVEYALSQARMDDAMPIRSELGSDGYYRLRAANGERRIIAAGSAHTALANADWPEYGKNAVLWENARRLAGEPNPRED